MMVVRPKQKCTICGSRTFKIHLEKPCCVICKYKIELMPEKLRKEFEKKWFNIEEIEK